MRGLRARAEAERVDGGDMNEAGANLARGLRHDPYPLDIHLTELLESASPHAHQGGGVVDALDARHGTRGCVPVAHVSHDALDGEPHERPGVARGPHQHANRIVVRQEVPHHRVSHEPGGAGDQRKASHSSLL